MLDTAEREQLGYGHERAGRLQDITNYMVLKQTNKKHITKIQLIN